MLQSLTYAFLEGTNFYVEGFVEKNGTLFAVFPISGCIDLRI